jgi:hypothetical protein
MIAELPDGTDGCPKTKGKFRLWNVGRKGDQVGLGVMEKNDISRSVGKRRVSLRSCKKKKTGRTKQRRLKHRDLGDAMAMECHHDAADIRSRTYLLFLRDPAQRPTMGSVGWGG